MEYGMYGIVRKMQPSALFEKYIEPDYMVKESIATIEISR